MVISGRETTAPVGEVISIDAHFSGTRRLRRAAANDATFREILESEPARHHRQLVRRSHRRPAALNPSDPCQILRMCSRQ